MYILFLLFTTTLSINGTISYLESYAHPTQTPQIRRLIAGEIHDADHTGQKLVLKQALAKYASTTQVPLTLHIEDPLAIPGLEHLPGKGLLLGLVSELKRSSLPSGIQVHNFDTKKAANCAIHFFSQDKPKLDSAIPELNELSFGHLITELERANDTYTTHSIVENLCS